ncbi:MAG: NAD-dependent succinate-semialdehyde dehydrogenase [bacterium JZ-2024 1]
MPLVSMNPANGELIAEYNEMSREEETEAIQAAARAFHEWRSSSIATRADLLRNLARLLRAREDDLARVMALEMGKPITQGRAEIEKCAWNCEYFASEGSAFLAPIPVSTEASKSYIAFEPLGVILAIMPWNFPFWQVFRCSAPILMAGNTILLKHASNVTACALAIQQLFRDAGFPDAVFQVLLVARDRVHRIISDPAVRGVTLTGSTSAGRAVAQSAGFALKKTVLELGGSDPYIILEDADLADAASVCASARLINSGQSCIAAKRFIVVSSRLNEFTHLLADHLKRAIVGDPLNEGTQVGPLARQDIRRDLHQQVSRSIQMGARLLLGGAIPEGPGFYYPPTLLTDVTKDMPVCKEETFGPVAVIISARDDEDAISLANDSAFGLGSVVFSRNLARAEHIAVHRLDSGSCFVNTFVRSDPRLPFGGVKDSGFGRELSSFGLREFTNIKTVFVK